MVLDRGSMAPPPLPGKLSTYFRDSDDLAVQFESFAQRYGPEAKARLLQRLSSASGVCSTNKRQSRSIDPRYTTSAVSLQSRSIVPMFEDTKASDASSSRHFTPVPDSWEASDLEIVSPGTLIGENTPILERHEGFHPKQNYSTARESRGFRARAESNTGRASHTFPTYEAHSHSHAQLTQLPSSYNTSTDHEDDPFRPVNSNASQHDQYINTDERDNTGGINAARTSGHKSLNRFIERLSVEPIGSLELTITDSETDDILSSVSDQTTILEDTRINTSSTPLSNAAQNSFGQRESIQTEKAEGLQTQIARTKIGSGATRNTTTIADLIGSPGFMNWRAGQGKLRTCMMKLHS
ncbi:hypothetical protein EJ05DRAFT_393728 [Pseudovirgaria hyperparasitica]|uniref:Uncharacterized protein n=1 Tax=Pseudovirgaria hyperparasitica TaxID=470096 RepID=A0A6A6W7J1_9PEZI|nr:uncharacterized protein EJ05DRAFT_393728 [Pseudovirgaria hyperparasitica]KAF2757547.1 hypothetical protein EJ05DRAFT_393728 [Pseudovirgaria hyperparasitica]